MSVGAGSIKRAAKTAVIGNPENLENVVLQEETDTVQTKKAVKEQAAEEKTTKETSAKKKAPARRNTAKTGAAKSETPKNVKAETKGKAGTDQGAAESKTYGINDELPIYLM